MGPGLRLGGIHPTRTEDEGEFVRIDVEIGQGMPGLRVGHGGVEELALGAHGDVLAGPHRQCAGEEAGDAGEEDDRVRHARGADAEDEGEVGDEAVVGAEDGGAEVAREPGAGPGGQGADHLGVMRSSAAISGDAATSS